MDMSKYKGMFISETTEHLQSMNQGLLAIEQDHKNQEAISEVFRNAHSIKGMAASMGYEAIRDLAHAMEDLMDDVRQGTREPGSEVMDVLFKGADTLEALLKAVAEDREEPDLGAEMSARIRAFRGGAKPAAPPPPPPPPTQANPAPGGVVKTPAKPPSPPPPPAASPAPPAAPASAGGAATPGANRVLRVVFSPQTASPGVRGLILFKRVGEVGQILGSRPSADEVKAGNFLNDPHGLAVEIDLLAEAPEADIVKVLNSITDIAGYEIKSVAAPAPASPPVPAAPAPEAPAPNLDGVVKQSGKLEQLDPFAAQAAQTQALPQTVRVKTSALDRFISALGEMILVKSELREVAKRNPIAGLERGVDRLEALVKDFRDQVMAIRMMPLEGVVQRLPRVVRDLAKSEGKKVRFEVRGQEIELDRAIVEELADPLIHLLRNCVNHGLETPDERVRAGKPPEGQIEIEAYRLRDLVLIEVRDDGRGMDPFLLREAAVAKGLMTGEEAAALSDEDAIQIIFRPGFSTAREVGMVSGRGVGMDAVKTVVEGVGGYVTVNTRPRAGTTFTLHLPRTIAIVNVLLVKLSAELFAIPITKIQKTVEILPHQVRKSQGKRFFLDRQEMVPIKPLHRFLDLPEAERDPRAPQLALIVATHNRKVALVVDDLVGQEEAFIRPLGKPLERISGLSGVTMLGDGRVVFVLDTAGML